MIMTVYEPNEEGPNKWVAWEGFIMTVYGTGPTEDEAVEDLKTQLGWNTEHGH